MRRYCSSLREPQVAGQTPGGSRSLLDRLKWRILPKSGDLMSPGQHAFEQVRADMASRGLKKGGI